MLQSVWGFPPPGRCCGHAGVLCYSPSGFPTSWGVLWTCWSVVLQSIWGLPPPGRCCGHDGVLCYSQCGVSHLLGGVVYMLECCVTVHLGFPPPGRCCGHAGVLCYSPSGLPTSWEVLWACWSVVLVSLGFPTSWEVSWACWSVVLQSIWGFPPPGRCRGHAGVRGTGIVSMVPSQLGCQANQENSCRHNPHSLSVFCQMPFLPVATLPIYLGFGPARGSAGFGPVTFGSPDLVSYGLTKEKNAP